MFSKRRLCISQFFDFVSCNDVILDAEKRGGRKTTIDEDFVDHRRTTM